MISRLILIPLITLMAAVSAASAWAQDKGTVNPKPLPPLANPNDPKVAAKELFGRKVLPAAMPTRVLGFYAHGCIAGAEGLPINGDNWQVMRLSRNRYWGHPDLIALVKRLAAKARKRSEERRVGKEGRAEWGADRENNNEHMGREERGSLSERQ